MTNTKRDDKGEKVDETKIEIATLLEVLYALSRLDPTNREVVLKAAMAFYNVDIEC